MLVWPSFGDVLSFKWKKNKKLLNSSYKAKRPSLRREKDSRDQAFFSRKMYKNVFTRGLSKKQSSSKHYCLHRTYLLLFHLLCPEDCGLFLRSFYCAQLQKDAIIYIYQLYSSRLSGKSPHEWVSEWKKLLFYYNPRKKCLVLKKLQCWISRGIVN